MIEEKLGELSRFAETVDFVGECMRIDHPAYDVNAFSARASNRWNNRPVPDSTACKVWDSGICLAKYIEQIGGLGLGKRIVELGSGWGVVGVTAARIYEAVDDSRATSVAAKQQEIVLTDGDEEAVRVLRLNHMRDRKDNEKTQDATRCHVYCEHLKWGDKAATARVIALGSGGRYDVVLASDLLYNRPAIDDLVETIEALVKEDGDVIVGWECREHLKFAEDHFRDLTQKHFSAKAVPHSALHPKYKFDNFRVLHLTPLPAGSVASVLGGLDAAEWSPSDDEEDGAEWQQEQQAERDNSTAASGEASTDAETETETRTDIDIGTMAEQTVHFPSLLSSPVNDLTSLLENTLHIDTQPLKECTTSTQSALADKNDNGSSAPNINLVETFREPTKQHKKQYQKILRGWMKKRKREDAFKPLYGPHQMVASTFAHIVMCLQSIRTLNLSLPAQRTDEWHKIRMNSISASECHKVLGNPKPVATLAFDKATNRRCANSNTQRHTAPTFDNARDWGVIFEDVCATIYCQLLRVGAVVEEFGSLPHPTIPFLRASPDGICNERSMEQDSVGTMVEFKAPYSRALKKACIKDDYLAQMQLQLEVTGLDKCDFLECVLELMGKDEAHTAVHPVPTTFHSATTRPLTTHAIGYIVSFPCCPSSAFVYGNLNDVDEASVQQSIASLDCTEEQRACAVVHYWRLKQYQIITVYRNREWFNEVMLPKLTSVWTRIQELVTDDEAYEAERSTRGHRK